MRHLAGTRKVCISVLTGVFLLTSTLHAQEAQKPTPPATVQPQPGQSRTENPPNQIQGTRNFRDYSVMYARIDEISKMAAADWSRNKGKLSKETEQAIAKFARELPHSERIRSMQREVNNLNGQLAKATGSPYKAQEIAVRMLFTMEQMEREDKAYADLMLALSIKLASELQADERVSGRPAFVFKEPRKDSFPYPAPPRRIPPLAAPAKQAGAGGSGPDGPSATSSSGYLSGLVPALANGRALFASSGIPVGTSRIGGAPPAPFASLERGDILLAGSENLSWKNFIYAWVYSHAGNYDGGGLVLEANADGVRLKPLSNWQQPGIRLAIGRNRISRPEEIESAMDWAKETYGTDGRTPYNYYFHDKATDKALYCSQLTWKIHNHIGVDLDSDNWEYLVWLGARLDYEAVVIGLLAVAPDEIRLSPNVYFYYEHE